MCYLIFFKSQWLRGEKRKGISTTAMAVPACRSLPAARPCGVHSGGGGRRRSPSTPFQEVEAGTVRSGDAQERKLWGRWKSLLDTVGRLAKLPARHCFVSLCSPHHCLTRFLPSCCLSPPASATRSQGLHAGVLVAFSLLRAKTTHWAQLMVKLGD